MESLARMRIVIWEGASLWIAEVAPGPGPKKRTDFHSHHAIQVTLNLGGKFMLESGEQRMTGDAVAVAPDTEHAFAAEGLVGLLFIEPESRSGRAVAGNVLSGAPLAAIPAALLGDLRARMADACRASSPSNEALVALGLEAIRMLAADRRPDVPDLRIRKMIAWAAQQLDRPVSLADAAAQSDLSPDRLRHLFVEQTGLPFRTYLLWLRLMRSVERLAAGSSLTQAAHEAGFADSAHFSRTFRRMFGVPPASLRIT